MQIAVVTTWVAGEVIHFRRETELVKAASLYADRIEVLSLSSLVYTDWGGIGPDDAAALREALVAPTGAATLPRFTTTSDRVAADSGVNDLLPAVRERLIHLNDQIPSTGDVWGAFMAELIRYLQDPNFLVLLDDRLSGIVTRLIASGQVQPSVGDRARASEAVLGTGLIARLPAFTEIPMSEVLELRRDLAGPLVRYRSAVTRLRAQEFDPYSPQRVEVVEYLWREQVEPALLDIREQLAEHALIRELARTIRADLRDLVKGAPTRAGVAVLAGAVANLDTAVSVAAAGVLGVVPPIADAVAARKAAQDEVQRRDFYYLYRLAAHRQR